VKRDKETLETGTVLISGDFAENFTHVVQDASQGFHWSAPQTTLHPWVVWHRDPADGQVKSFSAAVISDETKHDSVSVHCYKEKILNEVRARGIELKQVKYYSDGASSQYKNKYGFTDLAHHEEDNGVPATWTFFATSHGKGPCDGVGGTLKQTWKKSKIYRSI